jgi:hypothetical protein
MPQLVYLTDKPVRVTAAQTQDLRLAVDVGAVDELDVLLTVLEGTSVSVKLICGMALDDDSLGWVDLVSFSALNATQSEKKNVTGLLRYVRWEVTSSGNATFMLSGMARSWSGV